jgi:hypothetical protein
MKIETKFYIRQRVEIPEIKLNGTVSSIWITERGTQYQVRYFKDSELKEVYFLEHELKEASEYSRPKY